MNSSLWRVRKGLRFACRDLVCTGRVVRAFPALDQEHYSRARRDSNPRPSD
jgi:hypothetical protein